MPQFKFYLESQSGLLEKKLITAPAGWDENKPALTRDETYHGVMRSFTASLTFIRDGYDYLKTLYETEGILCNCYLYIYEHNNSTHEYELQDTGKIDFTTWDESDTSGEGVSVSITDSEFIEKITAREDTEINYNDNEDLDGNSMSDPVYIENKLYGMEVIYKSSGLVNQDDYVSFRISDSVVPDSRWIFDIDMDDVELDGFQTVTGQMWSVQDDGSPIAQEDLAFYITEAEGKIIFSGQLSFDFYVNKSDGLANTAGIFLIQYFATSGTSLTLKGWYASDEYTSGNAFYKDQLFDFACSADYSEGDRFYLIARCGNGTAYTNLSYLVVNESTLSFSVIDKYKETTSKAAFLFDVFNRCIESMTGVKDSLISTVLGEGGEFHDYTVQNGYLLRNFDTETAAMSFKFKDLFQNTEKKFNIGIAINSDNTVEIRKKQDFFKSYVIYTVAKSNMVADTFDRKINTDYFFSDIEVGYAKSAYEEVSGLEEYNNESYFSTILSALNNKLDLICKDRADIYGMEFARRKPYSASETEDTEYDSDNFLLNVIEEDGEWVQLTTEGFTDVSGLDDAITTPGNLKLTPAQNLRRWSWMIATGLQKYQESKIKFTKADSISDLSTTLNGVTVSESEDVPYSELEAPIFTGHTITFEAKLSLTDYNTLKSNPYGIVKFFNPVSKAWGYGWIKEVSVESVDKSTNFELIEAISAVEVLYKWLNNTGGNWLWNSGAKILLNDQN